MCCDVHLCMYAGDGVMTFVCACILRCNPFTLTVAVLSGDRKEAAENKGPTLDGPFYNTEPASHHNW